ncbi:PAS domain-containing sensor histidine kinase [Pontibacter sp. Tf4]|uniref:sensor histidine kinase n=1 Tax=Pontibacter sp. Tf4 TaxID=2761620 RepID=UPI001629E2D4|nr:PAS domain-containing sensor histidine kinase [Pontibacter sp. Tf4]MBB6612461.1 PAS domain-containing sensor histidine kinase [Pontibacter sp. Tf4]
MHENKKPAVANTPAAADDTPFDYKSEELYKLLIEGVKDYAIFMLDVNGNIATWNKGAERIKGYTAEDIIGKHFSIFYTQDALDSEFPQYELAQAKLNGRFEDEGWRVRKDGTRIWANVVITAIFDRTGRHIGFTKVTRDLSERRRNEELMFKNRELQRINTDLDNFIYTASHDLKAPIINLEGLVAVLKEDLGQDQHTEVLDRITGSIARLKNVINDLTDIVRLQDGSSVKEPIVLHELLDDVLASLSEPIIKTGAQINTNLKDFKLSGYSRKNLRSIFYNLISNALKYAQPGRTPEIDVSAALMEPGLLRLSVSDNGLGLSPTQKNKIFSMYKRMHTHVEGSGLGLYIVKRILENNGDRIEVESEIGKGTSFHIFFRLS